jgi:hypothetical protein
MHLAQDNDVVHALMSDRSDQPFGKAILPRRCRGGLSRMSMVRNRDDAAIDPVAIGG